MNLTALSDLVKNILNEEVTSTGSRLFTPDQMEAFLVDANRKIWREAVKAGPSLFTVRSGAVTLAPGEEFIDFSGDALHADGVYLPTMIEVASGDAWLEVTPILPQDRQEYALLGVPQGIPGKYYIEGEGIYPLPLCQGTTAFRVSFVPRCPALSDAQEALAGRLEEFHDLVAYEAAVKLAIKDQANPAGIMLMRDDAKKQMKEYLERRQRQRGRQIRQVRY